MMQSYDIDTEPPEPGEPSPIQSTKQQDLTPIQTTTPSNAAWTGLRHLQQLHSKGLIDDDEFTRRKQQLVDQLTGTRSDTKTRSRTPRRDKQVNESSAFQFDRPNAPVYRSLTKQLKNVVDQTQKQQTVEQSYGFSYNESIERAIYEEPCDEFDTSLSSEDSINDSTDDSFDQSLVEQSLHSASGVVVRPPPDFSNIQSERAVVHTFDMETSTWLRRAVKVRIEKRSFARGSLRIAYHMTGLQSVEQEERDRGRQRSRRRSNRSIKPPPDSPSSPVPASRSYVAKLSIDPFESRESYFADVVMQHYARAYARKYNSYGPPKPIEFLQAWLVELVDRPGQPLCACEVFVDGAYRKHNNNFGFVSEDERNTPQAFSHFSYESSSHAILICDIQGVGDVFTDPQIHSHDGIGFGKGNMGRAGFDQFCQSHRCNAICKYLKLNKCNPKQIDEDRFDDVPEGSGTMPATTYMSFQAVDTVRIEFNMAGSDSPVLKPRIMQIPPSEEQSKAKKKNLSSKTPLIINPPDKSVCCCTIM